MQQLVVFSLGSEEYGLPITAVQEIIRYSRPRTIPSSPMSVRGVINLRGKIIPVCDLKQRLGLYAEDGEEGKIVIVEAGPVTAGLIVDEVEEVLTVTSEQLEDVPTANRDSIEAIAKIDDRLVVLLNTPGLFAREVEDLAAAA